MRGISLAHDDSRVCDEDLELALADVMLSDTCMHSRASHQCHATQI